MIRELISLAAWLSRTFERAPSQQTATAPKDQGRSDERENPAPVRVVVESQIPGSVVEKDAAYQERAYNIRRWNLRVAWFTLIAVIVYAAVTYFLLRESQRGNDLSRGGLVAVQRAFVFPKRLTLQNVTFADKPEVFARVAVEWENSGGTPTKDLRLYVNYSVRPKAIPNDFDFPDLDAQGNITKDPAGDRILLGPKATSSVAPKFFSRDEVRAIGGPGVYGYIWGWAKYRDVFPETDPRITRFCWVITGFGINKDGSPAAINWHSCDHGNCADEECGVGSQQAK